MNPSSTPFLNLIVRLGGPDIRPDQFSTDVANRLRCTQLRRTIDQMRIMLLCNTFFAPILAFQAWGKGIDTTVILWTVSMVTFSWWLFYSQIKMYETNGSAHDMRQFVLETFVNACFWACGMILFYPFVDGDQKAIVATVMAGSLALGTVGFSQAPSAAFVYLSVVTVGSSTIAFLSGLATGSSTDYLIAFLSLAAGASVFNATLERGKSSIDAFRNHEKLSEKSEVVDLLLKDYEEQATEWLWQTDTDGKIIRAPEKILMMLGFVPENVVDQSLVELILDKGSFEKVEDSQNLRAAFDLHKEFHDFRFSIQDPQTKETRWILMKGRPQFVRSEFRGFRGLFADATASVTAEIKVRNAATYDGLTGLFNRASTHKHLTDLKVGANFAAAFLIDLDGFKQVNDNYGHQVGDNLLKEAAQRLTTIHRNGSFEARLGGDEFLIILSSAGPFCKDITSFFADQIVDCFSHPFQIGDFTIDLSASIGISLFPDDTNQEKELLSLADLALYQSKNKGKNRFEHFHKDMQTALQEKLAITEKLKTAIAQGAIVAHYQSQHSLKNGQLIGFEALARWIDDDLGFVGPDIFIPIAEQTGLIVELGEQILTRACREARHWVELLGEDAPILSVNFSPVQFARTDVAELVARVLRETNYPPDSLEIEITEGVLISNKEQISRSLRQISDLGVSIALDDFGTGYSSLSYLKDLPLDRLKIDRSFVSDMNETSLNPIVNSIIQLGQSLGLSVIAEGIEEQSQIDLLARMGCDDGQGYLYSRPVAIQEANNLVIQAIAPNSKQKKAVM